MSLRGDSQRPGCATAQGCARRPRTSAPRELQGRHCVFLIQSSVWECARVPTVETVQPAHGWTTAQTSLSVAWFIRLRLNFDFRT